MMAEEAYREATVPGRIGGSYLKSIDSVLQRDLKSDDKFRKAFLTFVQVKDSSHGKVLEESAGGLQKDQGVCADYKNQCKMECRRCLDVILTYIASQWMWE